MGIGNESTFISLAHQACTGRTAGKEIRAQVFWAIFTAYRGISSTAAARTASYSTPLHTSEGTSNMDAVLNTVPTKVTAAMNSSLLAAFSEKEVKEALF